MKKLIDILFLFLLTLPGRAQTDSVEEELKRLRKMGDSMHQLQKTRDSLFMDKMNRHLTGARQDVANHYQQQADAAYQEVTRQQEKAAARRQVTMLLSLGAVLAAALAVFIIKRRNKTHVPKP